MSLRFKEGGVGVAEEGRVSGTRGVGTVEVGLLGTSSIAGRGWGLEPIAVRLSGVRTDSSDLGCVKLVCPVCLLNQNDFT